MAFVVAVFHENIEMVTYWGLYTILFHRRVTGNYRHLNLRVFSTTAEQYAYIIGHRDATSCKIISITNKYECLLN